MMTFNEYWKEKGQKRRKSWAAKAKRFAEQHTQLEDIRKEVYLCKQNVVFVHEVQSSGFTKHLQLTIVRQKSSNLV